MTMMSLRLPSPKAIRDVLADLIGRDVSVQVSDPPAGARIPVAAVFVRDDLALAAVVGFDLPLAANLSAALGLVPPGGAEACVEDGELTPTLADNLTELCNVLAGVFNHAGGPHVRLLRVHLTNEPMPGDVVAHLQALGNRLDLAVTTPGYGTGAFILVLPN